MMLSYALYFFLFLSIFPAVTPAAADASPAYTATDLILLNCGESSNLNDPSGRSWDSDEHTSYMPPNAAAISSPHRASRMQPSVSQVPYETARVFKSDFTYSFPVQAGPKFIRLYFYAPTDFGLSNSQIFFSVNANGFMLLRSFGVSLNSLSSSETHFKKEFIINVHENQRLNVTIIPERDSFAFINGIEIVSLPDHLYFRGNDVPIKSGDQLFYLDKNTALENLYRLNVGGNYVEIQDDSGPTRGMFRAWSKDDDYMLGANSSYTLHREDLLINYTDQTPPYSAPEIVYKTCRVMANTSRSLEWTFRVDSGSHLLRFHFCDIQLEVTEQNDFDISVDNQTLDVQVDVISGSGGRGTPIFRDYVTSVPDDGSGGKKDLRLSLVPNTTGHPEYANALLNGLEIFKLIYPLQSLAPNPQTPPSTLEPLKPPKNKKDRGSSIIYPVIGSLIGVLAMVAAMSFLIFQRHKKLKDSLHTSQSQVPLPSDSCRRFFLEEIKTGTSNFHDNFIIGKGGFGNVYKGFIDDGATAVAIKRLNPSSNQGAREFLNEIEMLSKLRYLHLVSLIGYCEQNGEMILIYDYMAHGTLRDHLYNTNNSPLKWKQRLQICIGAAKGLCYLHTSGDHAIIHRDIKSTNILLDEKWVAKVSDFGLSKVGPTGDSDTHVSTAVKGSFGYVDPEYYKRQQLTDKSDVYSFGVVLFEVLCARPAIIPSFPGEQVNLAEWANFCYREGRIQEIIDPNLDGQIAPECLSKFVETGVMCLREKGLDRPAMNDVVWNLEHAMQLQEAAENRGCDALDGNESFVGMNPSFRESSEALSRFKGFSLSSDSNEKLKWGEVFSELKNPVGR